MLSNKKLRGNTLKKLQKMAGKSQPCHQGDKQAWGNEYEQYAYESVEENKDTYLEITVHF